MTEPSTVASRPTWMEVQPSHSEGQAFGAGLSAAAATEAARAVCKLRFEAFGCAGHAERIRALPLEVMATRYH